jgi:hypothetical protein
VSTHCKTQIRSLLTVTFSTNKTPIFWTRKTWTREQNITASRLSKVEHSFATAYSKGENGIIERTNRRYALTFSSILTSTLKKKFCKKRSGLFTYKSQNWTENSSVEWPYSLDFSKMTSKKVLKVEVKVVISYLISCLLSEKQDISCLIRIVDSV